MTPDRPLTGGDGGPGERPGVGRPGGRSPTAPAGPSPSGLGHVRVRFAKLGKLRWTSHRDVARMWERALRRAGMPVATSGGFSPHPLLSFGLALPTGCESTAEYVDVALDPGPAGVGADLAGWAAEVAEAFPGRLSPLLPDGVDVLAAGARPADGPSLQQEVTSCTWRIEVPDGSAPVIADRVAAAMTAASLPVERERKGRRQLEDLRPSLLSLELTDGDGPRAVVLLAETATRPRGVRPAELADALGVPLGPARRTNQWIDRDGSRWEPIVTGPAPTPLAVGCPS